MSKPIWLPLTDYSNKYRVSISTLRRRIKANQVEYTLEDGKYLLRDLPLKQHEVSSPDQAPVAHQTAPKASSNSSNSHQNWNRVTSAPPQQAYGHPEDPVPPVVTQSAVAPPAKAAMPAPDHAKFEASIQALLGEIKKAYSMILQEKEEQIIMLKEEVTDLRTLVRVLESENDRLKANSRDAAPIDSWLDDIEALEK